MIKSMFNCILGDWMYRSNNFTEKSAVPGAGLKFIDFPEEFSKLTCAEKSPLSTSVMLRIVDVILALGLAIVFLPFVALICLMIKIQDGGPILFRQQRIGRSGRLFECWKFRSMHLDAESRLEALLASDPALRREWLADRKLKKDPRVTLVGDFLRKSSLDELPQLFNILLGQMSMVGPRPIIASEVACYERWFHYYTSVKPGLTGLWQVSGRNNLSYRRRVAIDRYFYRSKSVRLYISILILTVPAVLLRRGSC